MNIYIFQVMSRNEYIYDETLDEARQILSETRPNDVSTENFREESTTVQVKFVELVRAAWVCQIIP